MPSLLMLVPVRGIRQRITFASKLIHEPLKGYITCKLRIAERQRSEYFFCDEYTLAYPAYREAVFTVSRVWHHN